MIMKDFFPPYFLFTLFLFLITVYIVSKVAYVSHENAFRKGHGFPLNMFGGNAANRNSCQLNRKTLKLGGMCNTHDPF